MTSSLHGLLDHRPAIKQIWNTGMTLQGSRSGAGGQPEGDAAEEAALQRDQPCDLGTASLSACLIYATLDVRHRVAQALSRWLRNLGSAADVTEACMPQDMAELPPIDQHLEKEHQEKTKVKNIQCVEMGKYEVSALLLTWPLTVPHPEVLCTDTVLP